MDDWCTGVMLLRRILNLQWGSAHGLDRHFREAPSCYVYEKHILHVHYLFKDGGAGAQLLLSLLHLGLYVGEQSDPPTMFDLPVKFTCNKNSSCIVTVRGSHGDLVLHRHHAQTIVLFHLALHEEIIYNSSKDRGPIKMLGCCCNAILNSQY